MKAFSTLTNRIFVTSAALAVVSIGVAITIVNVRVTREAESELQRGLQEAGRLVDQHHEMRVESALRMARLVADLPKLKAAVDLADPPTVEPLAVVPPVWPAQPSFRQDFSRSPMSTVPYSSRRSAASAA